MKKGYTHVGFVIDRSGSMGGCWNDVCGAYTRLIQDQRKEEGNCTVTVSAFDTEIDVLEDFVCIQKANDTLAVRPRGGTALLDAIGITITKIGDKLAKLPENERPEKVLVIVQTDGDENSSREYSKARIKEMIEEQQSKYAWEFQFIGASLDAINQAKGMGFTSSNSAHYLTSNSDATIGLLSKKMSLYRSATDSVEATRSLYFSDSEREEISK